MRSPIVWAGGKHKMLKHLKKYLDVEHNTYVEVFGGAGHLLFSKNPSKVEIYNDVYSDLVNFYRVIRDKDKLDEFMYMVELTPYSQEEFYFLRDSLKDGNLSTDIERAHAFFVVNRLSFAGNNRTFGRALHTSNRGMSHIVSSFLSSIDSLYDIHSRLRTVHIDNDDFAKTIKRYDSSNTLFYCDPPYVYKTRKENKEYKHELTDDRHQELVELLLNFKGKCFLSCYFCDIYNPLVSAGWYKEDFTVACYEYKPNTKRQTRIETVISNFDPRKK